MSGIEYEADRIITEIVAQHDGYETEAARAKFRDDMRIKLSDVIEWRRRVDEIASKTIRPTPKAPPGRPLSPIGSGSETARRARRGRSRPPRGPRSAE
ncbi:hypothetical protein ACIO6U_08920 [Streptomyces sp. NPDC087422]|uniref:hypothetical protein n=1 Tax=Streptomyces sp. NPDC087422 TaxID=3365786 RepID=UPI0037F73561